MSQPIAAQQTENEKRAGGHHSNKQMLVKHHRANWCLETARCVQNIIKKKLTGSLVDDAAGGSGSLSSSRVVSDAANGGLGGRKKGGAEHSGCDYGDNDQKRSLRFS